MAMGWVPFEFGRFDQHPTRHNLNRLDEVQQALGVLFARETRDFRSERGLP